MAKMPALERLLLPSGCLDLRSTAALRQQEVLSGRAFLPWSLDWPWHFVPLFHMFNSDYVMYRNAGKDEG